MFAKRCKLSKHAREQCGARGIATAEEVEAALRGHEREISQSQSWQVKVIVKRVAFTVTAGSQGDLVVACVDPSNLVVKTVMLEGYDQYLGRSKSGRTGEYIWA